MASKNEGLKKEDFGKKKMIFMEETPYDEIGITLLRSYFPTLVRQTPLIAEAAHVVNRMLVDAMPGHSHGKRKAPSRHRHRAFGRIGTRHRIFKRLSPHAQSH